MIVPGPLKTDVKGLQALRPSSLSTFFGEDTLHENAILCTVSTAAGYDHTAWNNCKSFHLLSIMADHNHL
jgi:hypothetical protein